MANAGDQTLSLYEGRTRHTIDGSRRVMLPAKWRESNPAAQFVSILWPVNIEDYVLVLPPERWARVQENLREISLSDEDMAPLERVISETSARLELDRFGRVCLPEDFVAALGLKGEVDLVGRLDKFEIWNPVKRAEKLKEDKAKAAAVLKNKNVKL